MMNFRFARPLYAILALVLAFGAVVGASYGSNPNPPAAAEPAEAEALAELERLLDRTADHPSTVELAGLEQSNSGTRAAALSRFLRGAEAIDKKQWDVALSALDAAEIQQRTSLGDYGLLYQGRALVELGRTETAARILERVGKEYPDSLVAAEATVESARAYIAAGENDDAVEVLEPVVEKGHGEALVTAAEIHIGRGNTARANRLLLNAYFYDPAGASAKRVESMLQSLGTDPATVEASEEELLSRANRLYDASRWGEAADAYGRLVAAYPNRTDRDALNLRRGIAANRASDRPVAIASLQIVSSADPASHAEALYQLAVAYRRSGQGELFESTGARLRSIYPTSAAAGEFLTDYVDYLGSARRESEKAQAERALIAGYPLSRAAADASYEAAWLAYRTNSYKLAADLFLEHLATFRTPASRWIGEAAYWGGRAYEKSGNLPRALLFFNLAKDRYPYGYHGHVARRRLEALASTAAKVKPEEPKPGTPVAAARDNALAVQPIVETADSRADSRLGHADDFDTIRLWEHSVKELTAAQELFPESPRVNLRFAQHFRNRGDFFQATLILRRGYPDVYSYRDDQMPREAWEVMFPLTHWDTIKSQARANNMDPFIIAGVIRQESVFNPRALSRANARGMMQLLPSTGRLVARSRGLGSVSAADLYNPTLNITLGTSYFATQFEKFGRIEYAAAAYNAGPGRVVQWRNARPNVPLDEWVELIPFNETRGYVMGVIRYAANYRRLYGKGNDGVQGDW